MIDVYFMLKKSGEEVGGVSLQVNQHGIQLWRVYKVYPITEKTVLFASNVDEFCTINGKYHHEMGDIEVKYMENQWLNVRIKEKKQKEN